MLMWPADSLDLHQQVILYETICACKISGSNLKSWLGVNAVATMLDLECFDLCIAIMLLHRCYCPGPCFLWSGNWSHSPRPGGLYWD